MQGRSYLILAAVLSEEVAELALVPLQPVDGLILYCLRQSQSSSYAQAQPVLVVSTLSILQQSSTIEHYSCKMA